MPYRFGVASLRTTEGPLRLSDYGCHTSAEGWACSHLLSDEPSADETEMALDVLYGNLGFIRQPGDLGLDDCRSEGRRLMLGPALADTVDPDDRLMTVDDLVGFGRCAECISNDEAVTSEIVGRIFPGSSACETCGKIILTPRITRCSACSLDASEAIRLQREHEENAARPPANVSDRHHLTGLPLAPVRRGGPDGEAQATAGRVDAAEVLQRCEQLLRQRPDEEWPVILGQLRQRLTAHPRLRVEHDVVGGDKGGR